MKIGNLTDEDCAPIAGRVRRALDELAASSGVDKREIAEGQWAPYAVPRQGTRRSVAAVAVVGLAAVVVLGVVLGTRGADVTVRSNAGTQQRAASATAYGVPEFSLSLGGAFPVSNVTSHAASSDSAFWLDRTMTASLYLVVRPGLAEQLEQPTGVGPMVRDADFPPERGRAWTAITRSEGLQTVTMWWDRIDGDLWLLTAHWYRAEERDPIGRIRHWGLSINESPGDTTRVEGSDLQLVASDLAAKVRSRTQLWTVDDQEVVLLLTEQTVAAGLGNLFDLGTPSRTMVDGRDAWMVRDGDETITVGWEPRGETTSWAVLTVPAALSDRLDDLLAGLSQGNQSGRR